VKFGIICRHFSVSIAIFSRRYGNLCCSIVRSGRLVVITVKWFYDMWVF
jgi:hypothetical protein